MSVSLNYIYLIMICGLVIASIVDLRCRVIPDKISVGGMLLGLSLSFIVPALHGTQSHLTGLLYSFVGLLVGGGLIYIAGLIGDIIFKIECVGGGDVKLLAMIGSFLGWQLALLTFLISISFGLVTAIFLRNFTNKKSLAFGVFLTIGAIASMVVSL